MTLCYPAACRTYSESCWILISAIGEQVRPKAEDMI